MPIAKVQGCQSPIFIGGMFKSGTSLFRAMIGQHSNIAAGLETYWFGLDWRNKESSPWLGHIRRIARLFSEDEDETVAAARTAQSAEQFLDSFMTAFAKKQNKHRWAEKTPGNITQIGRILDFWPEACVIHIVRDPRDVFASLLEAGKLTAAEEFVPKWNAVVPYAEAFLNSNQGSNNFLELRYEDLVRQPLDTMRQALGFIHEPWEKEVAHFSGVANDYEKVLQVTGKASSTLERLRKPMGTDRVGLWRQVLGETNSTELLAVADQLGHGKLMRRLIDETPK